MKVSTVLLLVLLVFACSVGMADAPAIDPGPVVVPPDWLLNALDFLASIPVVGPYVAAIVQWAGVVAVVLTSLVSFLVPAIKALMKVLDLAQLVKLSELLGKFQDSKVMYWLRAFSNLPPKKVESPK